MKEQESDNLTDKINLYSKNLNEPKYQFLIKKHEGEGGKNIWSKAFIKYSTCMYDVYNSINGYNLNRNRKILIVFDDIIVNIMTNKKLQAIIKEVFIRCRKLYLSLVFIIQSYFSVPKRI